MGGLPTTSVRPAKKPRASCKTEGVGYRSHSAGSTDHTNPRAASVFGLSGLYLVAVHECQRGCGTAGAKLAKNWRF